MIFYHHLAHTLSVFTKTHKYLQRSKSSNEDLEQLKRLWAQDIVKHLKVDLLIKGEPSLEAPLIFVGNHMSYMDIPLLMSVVPNISFVAKKELLSWPVFGAAAQKANTVFVDRDKKSSRNQVRKNIEEGLLKGKRIALFPSGTTCIEEKGPWRKGAFEIAKNQNVKIQPFRIKYTPLRKVAYIDKDFFPTHLYNLSKIPSVQSEIEFHHPVDVENAEADCVRWHFWSKELLSV